MKKTRILNYGSFVLLLFVLTLSACDSNASQKQIGGSQDTTSVTKGGGPTIRDTATINKDRKDSANMLAPANAAKGNADPSGRMNPKASHK